MPIGFNDGFDWLAQRYTDEQHELTIEEVSRIHLDGGVLLGASRRDVTRDPESLENTSRRSPSSRSTRSSALAATTWCAAPSRSSAAAS